MVLNPGILFVSGPGETNNDMEIEMSDDEQTKYDALIERFALIHDLARKGASLQEVDTYILPVGDHVREINAGFFKAIAALTDQVSV